MTHQIVLSETNLSIDATYQYLQDPEAGGICLFVGTIRNKNQNKDVEHLTMEAYSAMAKNRWNASRPKPLNNGQFVKLA